MALLLLVLRRVVALRAGAAHAGHGDGAGHLVARGGNGLGAGAAVGALGREGRGSGAADAGARPVGGVDCLELAVLDHGLQHAGVEELGLLDDARDHLLAGGLELGAHEAGHGDVAADLDIFTKIQAVDGDAEAGHADLGLVRGLDAGLVAVDAVLDADVDVHGGVGVCLQAPGHVVEAAVEGDLAGAHLADAGDELDALGDLVPGGVVLVGGGVAGRLDGLVVEDEGVEGDDLGVGVEDVDGELAGDESRDGGDGRVDLLLAQHGDGSLGAERFPPLVGFV